MRYLDEERLREFRRFYEELDERENVFYLFFTTGLLHWVCKSLQFVPASIPVVLIGSGLSREEREWVDESLGRPFFCFPENVDEGIVWDYLFAVNTSDFGWLDIDCFVLNPDIFDEMAEIRKSDSMNCIWSYDYGLRTEPRSRFSFPVVRTFFLFVNQHVIQRLNRTRQFWSPRPFLWEEAPASSSFKRYSTFHLLPEAHKENLARILPMDSCGNAIFPVQEIKKDGVVTRHLDTMVLYQLLAHEAGYRLRQVRRLDENGTAMTDEVIHVGSISYYRSFGNPDYETVNEEERSKYREIYERVLLLDYLIAGQFQQELPKSYSVYKRMLEREIRQIGKPLEGVLEEAVSRMTDEGLSRESALRICSGGRP
ncbi:hypothetical protein [Paenibacillus lutrae]|uniref:Uncharacterized protein n=1 Tax=Paenibacillus lutrae TaxID=2078573 RepID=A0A7X3JYA1_9BACL|nr:hypothetical protein [Paenibacillus lutrae]MVO98851.1 hypothetical protein [Paenibacillus lutrae]